MDSGQKTVDKKKVSDESTAEDENAEDENFLSTDHCPPSTSSEQSDDEPLSPTRYGDWEIKGRAIDF